MFNSCGVSGQILTYKIVMPIAVLEVFYEHKINTMRKVSISMAGT